MAKKKKKKNSGIVSFLSSTVSFFRDDRFRYAMGIVFLLVALFLFVAFISAERQIYGPNKKTAQRYRELRLELLLSKPA